MDTSALEAKMGALRTAQRHVTSVSRHLAQMDDTIAPKSTGLAKLGKLRQRAGRAMGRVAARRGFRDDPPAPPDPNQIMEEARRKSLKIGVITAGCATWRESAVLYRAYRRGQPLTGLIVWNAARRAGQSSINAAVYAGRRHLLVVGIDTMARMVAYNTARKAKSSVLYKVVHVASKRLAGKASVAVTGVEVFMSMHRDIKRYRSGDLAERDFYVNCALTGVTLVAPMAGGAAFGPAGATVGTVVAVGAGMLKK